MRTTDERVKSIMQKTAEKRKKINRRRQFLTRCGAYASCLFVICVLGYRLSDSRGIHSFADSLNLHAASIVGEGNTLEYVIIGVAAFVLGVLTEILLTKLHEKYGGSVKTDKAGESGRSDDGEKEE
ncbi:MAG: hypothetical protein ACI4LC_02575 [Emergencia sp.]